MLRRMFDFRVWRKPVNCICPLPIDGLIRADRIVIDARCSVHGDAPDVSVLALLLPMVLADDD